MGFSSGTFSYTGSSTTFSAPVTGTTISSTAATAAFTETATGLSTCLLKDGTQTVTANIPMAGFKFTGLGAGSSTGDSLRYQQLFTTSAVQLLGPMEWVKGADIASPAGGTLDLTAATGNAVHVTGTNAITAVTLGSGMWRLVIFDGALTLTHHATTNNLPGAANITTATNDRALYWADGTTSYCVSFTRNPSLPATDTVPGVIEIATQAEIETGTDTGRAVTPGRQQFHSSAAKAWVFAGVQGTALASYNITSVTDVGTGTLGITLATDFDTDLYAAVAIIHDANDRATQIFTKSTGTCTVRCAAGGADPSVGYYFAAFGDQA